MCSAKNTAYLFLHRISRNIFRFGCRFQTGAGHLPSGREGTFAFWHLKIEPDEKEMASDRPSIQSKVRPTTLRPVLLRRKSYIVPRARILASIKAHTKETTKEVARPKAEPPLLWWRPKAAQFVCALNEASILALSTIYDLRLSKTGPVVRLTFDWMDCRSDAVSLLSGSFSSVHVYACLVITGQTARRQIMFFG